MTDTEITLGIGVIALAINSVADHLMRGSQTEQSVRKMVAELVEDLRWRVKRVEEQREECAKELADLRELISDITPDREPAE